MIELLTPEEMATADRITIESGTPGIELMENAGRGVADVVVKIAPNSNRIIVLAGPGNNGGDGFVAARILKELGYAVEVGLLELSKNIKGDAKLAFNELKKLGIGVQKLSTQCVNDGDIFIDALFGAGLCREIDGLVAELIMAINDSRKPVVAVDLPSGIDGKTGKELGISFKASETVTFFRKKLGHLLYPGRENCGNISVIDIGIPVSVLNSIEPSVFCNRQELWQDQIPRYKVTSHKYDRGHAVVYSGSIQATGAARLCAEAALRIGAGLVTLATPPSALVVNASQLTAVMVKPVANVDESKQLLSDKRLNAVAIGPGFGVGKKTVEFVLSILNGDQSVVLDADGLTSFSEEPTKLFAQIKKFPSREVVLTPHEGEFSCLFGDRDSENKVDCARHAAKISQAIVVLKGADTVIAHPEGRCVINENAPPWLATAGSGDVLAGIICGLLAQSVPAYYAACIGVWIHSEAARELGPGLISEDLLYGLRPIINSLFHESL